MRISLHDTPNGRLLYKESLDSGRDWQNIGHEVELFLQEIQGLSPVNSHLYLYFFESVQTIDELLVEPWVGREVIGFADLEEEEEFSLHDLHRGRILAMPLGDFNSSEFELGDLLRREHQERQKFQSEHTLAETWRLKLIPKRTKDTAWGLMAELQFFIEDPAGDAKYEYGKKRPGMVNC